MGGGTGLGLSIVRGIIEGHHGRIWAESEGEDLDRLPGAKLIMLLPIKQTAVSAAVDELEIPAPDMRATAPQPSQKPGVKRKILLIEDDEDIITFTRLILEKKYKVMISRDGFEGLKLAFSEKPDVVLLDVWMHGIDGLEVCRILKGNAATSGIRVAIFSAAAQKHEIKRGYDAGADDYITKPFTPTELVTKIEALIDKAAEVA